jgi:hypothetical protein
MQQAVLPAAAGTRAGTCAAATRRRRAPPARCSSTAEAPPAAAPYEGVFDKPLGLKFSRGNDGGAYLVSKTPAPEYAEFNIGDKILEVRHAARRGVARFAWRSSRQPLHAARHRRRDGATETLTRSARARAAPRSDPKCGRLRTMDKVRASRRRSAAYSPRACQPWDSPRAAPADTAGGGARAHAHAHAWQSCMLSRRALAAFTSRCSPEEVRYPASRLRGCCTAAAASADAPLASAQVT